MILSGVMMFDYLGWTEVSKIISDAMEKTILEKKVTYDLARQMNGSKKLSTSDYADAIISNF